MSYDAQWYEDRWQSMSPELRKRAADAIRSKLDEETVELIRRKHAEFGHDWIHHLVDLTPEDAAVYGAAVGGTRGTTTMSAHHGWGTSIRNLLRSKEGANIPDADLPGAEWTHVVMQDGSHPVEHNWDDYYTMAVEAAIGLRGV